MKPTYQAILFNASGEVVATFQPLPLKKDVEAMLEGIEIAFDHAKIETIYVKGGGEIAG